MSIPIGNKFAAVVLTNVFSEVSTDAAFLDGLSIHSALPFDVTPDWDEAIGSFHAEELRDAGLAFLANAPSAQPDMLDSEFEALRLRAYRLFQGLLLYDVPSYGSSMIIEGSNVRGTSNILSISTMETYLRNETGSNQARRVADQDIQLAGKIGSELIRLYTNPNLAAEMKTGLRAFFRAIREPVGPERLLQFVVSLDALIRSDVGKGKRLFKHRPQTFCSPAPTIQDVLGEIYDLRSKAAHARGLEEAFTDPNLDAAARDDRALHRLRQVEALARHVFREILTSPTLCQHFSSAVAIDAFWDPQDGTRRKDWANRIDILAVL